MARRRLLAALVAAAALTGAGCGSEEEQGEGLPQDAVASLDRRFDEVENRYRDGIDGNVGACNDISTDSIPAIREQISNLPQDVDPDIVDALEASVDRLAELTRVECADVRPEETDTATEEETVPQVTIPEETAPEETTTEEAPKEEKKQEKERQKEEEKGDDGGGGQTPPPDGGGGGGAPAPEPQ